MEAAFSNQLEQGVGRVGKFSQQQLLLRWCRQFGSRTPGVGTWAAWEGTVGQPSELGGGGDG